MSIPCSQGRPELRPKITEARSSNRWRLAVVISGPLPWRRTRVGCAARGVPHARFVLRPTTCGSSGLYSQPRVRPTENALWMLCIFFSFDLDWPCFPAAAGGEGPESSRRLQCKMAGGMSMNAARTGATWEERYSELQ